MSQNSVWAATPKISSFTLNGSANNVTFNPNNGETVQIDVKADQSVKFTRLYICSAAQTCTGSSGNYTRYFTQSDYSQTISKSWNGKTSGDAGLVPSGEYRVMVSMTEVSGTSATTEFGDYKIYVDYSGQAAATSTGAGSDNSSGTSETNDTTVAINSPGVSSNTSTHSAEEGLSDYNPTQNMFEVSAGRDRLSYVGMPVKFQAKAKTSSDLSVQNKNYVWSFGDGTSATGESVGHIYKYPGDYNVVLNGDCGSNNSISRAVVKVLRPNIVMARTIDGSIEIWNKGKEEINLNDWKVMSGGQSYVFPLDTIIGGNKRVVFPSDYTKVSINDGVELLDPSGKTVLTVKFVPEGIEVPVNQDEATTTVSVNKPDNVIVDKKDVERFVANFKAKNNSTDTAGLDRKSVPDLAASAPAPAAPDEGQPFVSNGLTATVADAGGSQDVSIRQDSIPTSGFWNKIAYPFRFIRKTFYK